MLKLNIIECKNCGSVYWYCFGGEAIEAGPCCFGHPVLDVERFTTRDQAEDVFNYWLKAQARSVKSREIELARK